MSTYCELSKALDSWAGYHDRMNRTIRAVCESLADHWGRMPDDRTARHAAKLIGEYHLGHPEKCPRAAALLKCLGV